MEKFDLFKQALNKKNEIKQELEEIQQRYISACVRVDELSNEITEMVKLCRDDNARDERYAAIRYAAMEGHTDVVLQLIRAYKYPRLVLSEAIELASSEGHFDILHMLNMYLMVYKSPVLSRVYGFSN
jgi:hypothetical protein